MTHRGVAQTAQLIGRAREVRVLEQGLRAAQGGTGQVVILSGEAGIGKSRLVTETTGMAVVAGFTVVRGACYEQDQAFPYAPWIEGLRSVLARGDAVHARAALIELGPDFAGLLSGSGWTLSPTLTGQALEPEAKKRWLFETVVHIMVRLAETRPLLLILEDLHWSDASSLELLRFFARRLDGQRIMLLATYRSDDVSSPLGQLLTEFDRLPWGQELALAPLSRGEVEALVHARLEAGQAVQPDFIDFIVSLTDGNPFFIEEVLKSLVEAGDNADAGSRREWRTTSVPRSVQEVVWQRTRHLSAGAQQLLRWAAVVGRHVDFTLVEALMGMKETDLLDLVRELIAAQLLVEASADELVFRHALTREAVNTSLLARERRALHRQIVAVMEEQYASSLDAHAGDLAHHAYEAEDWARAMAYSQRAGAQAQAQYATHESLAHYSRGLDAARRLSLDPPLDLLSARAQVYENLGEFDSARADYEQALTGARAAGNRLAEWQTLLDLGFLWAERDYARSGDYLQGALALAYRLENPASVAHSLNRLGNWHFNRMRLAEALACYRQGLEIFREIEDRLGVAETLDLLGSATFTQGDLIAGRSYFGEAIGVFRELGSKRRLAQCLIMLPLAYRFNTEILGQIEPAELLAAGEEGLQMAREIGWRSGELQAYARQTQYAREAGEYGQALAFAGNGLAIAEQIGHVGFLSAGHWGMGDLYLDLFAVEKAAPHIEQARSLARDFGSGIFQHHADMALARLCLLRGQWARAEAVLGPHPSLPEAHLVTQGRENWAMWAEVLLAKQDAAEALVVVDRLIAGTFNAEQYGPRAVPRLSLLRGRALYALGRHDEAEEELQAAWEVARSQGKRSLLWGIALYRGRTAQAQGRRGEARQAFAAAAEVITELANGLPDDGLRESFLRNARARLPKPRPMTPRHAAREAFDGLSAREREVAALITTGKSNRQIAETLVIAERTVDRHIANIMAKLAYSSRVQIAAWAVEKGLRPSQTSDE